MLDRLGSMVGLEGAPLAHILIHEPRHVHEQWESLLAGKGRKSTVCADREKSVAALEDRPPDVLVYVLTEMKRDIDLLCAVRCVASTLPIILLNGPTDLASRRAIQKLRPTYYGVYPLENSELSDVVGSALNHIATRCA